jgi:transposase-like protein
LRKVTKNRSAFVNNEAIFKILYLAIRNTSEKWTMPIRDWGRRLTN